jgi:DNA (cytosine-5)-methyltransferase 1
MSSGAVYRRPTWEPPTSGSGSSSWPTARAQDGYERRNWKTIVRVNEQGGDLTLASKAGYWPTPRANEGSQQNSENRGMALSKAAPMWKTPRAMEDAHHSSDPGYSQRLREKAGGKHEMLSDQVKLWPTPSVTEPGFPADRFVDRDGNRPTHAAQRLFDPATGTYRQKGLTQAAQIAGLWPTPDTGESPRGHGRRGGSPENSHQSGASLDRSAEKWPTPQTDSFRSRGGDRVDEPGLDRMAKAFTNEESKNWPTPRTKQGKTYPQHQRDGRQGLTLEGVVDRWMTPRSHEVGDYQQFPDGKRRPTLTGQASDMWATQIGRDWKDAGMDPKAETPTNAILGRQVLRTGLPVPPSGRSGSGSSPGGPASPRPPSRPRLNPAFVTWLQGLPPGWVDPTVPVGTTCFDPWATQLSRQVRHSLSQSSTEG